MVTTPVSIPVTIPVEPTVAAELLLLLHVPPPTPSVKATVAPWHTVAVSGEIGPGAVTTVTIFVAGHEPMV